jgi:serine/threonine-protein kinase haspin
MHPPDPLDINKTLMNSSGFGLSSLETTIIDYSLSRATLRPAQDGSPNEVMSVIASSDLDSKQIFDAAGQDEDEIFLRDTYR